MNGIEKDIDNLGRVVIPMEFRKNLGLEARSTVFVSLKDGVIHIIPTNTRCALCGSKIEEEQEFRLCKICISKIKSEK